MANLEQRNEIDFRRGGDAVHDLTEKYIEEIYWIFNCLNAIRGNRESPGLHHVDPTAGQIKVEDKKIYVRNDENTSWIYLGEAKTNFGFRNSVDDKFMTTADIATSASSGAGKIVTLNANGVIPFSITGNAGQLAGKSVAMSNLSDGQVLTYRATTNSWTNEDKGVVGSGKALTLRDGSAVLATYDGDKAVDLNLSLHLLQRSRAYAVGDIAYSPKLPSNLRLECVKAGTTAEVEPSL